MSSSLEPEKASGETTEPSNAAMTSTGHEKTTFGRTLHYHQRFAALLMLGFHSDRADAEYREREEIRRERNKERQRDRNLARAGTDKRNRIQRERERDISEKIALGMPNTGRGQDADGGFDSRLFNREKVRQTGWQYQPDYAVVQPAL